MRRSSSWPAVTLLVVALAACAGCGGSTVSAGSGEDSPTASATGSDAPTDLPAASAMVVTRSGGLAGFRDMVQVAADGKASITSKTGKRRTCTPSEKALDQLRAVDLKAVAAVTLKPPQIADGFSYSVKSASGAAAASEGDDDSRRAELVDAAAAVVASCLASQSGSGSKSY